MNNSLYLLSSFRRFIPAVVLCFLLHPFSLNAQTPIITADTLAPMQTQEAADTTFHDPRKAVMYSAMLPGLGQIYNRKYWKVPIVYAGFATLAYYIDHNGKHYKDLKQAMIDFPDYNSKFYPEDLSYEQLELGKNYFKRWRDLSILGTIGFYVLQMVDASVDAHLINWNVGDDLSLELTPAPVISPLSPVNSFGLRACISF
jgi:hypothetical protein